MKPILCNTSVVQNIDAGRQVQDRRPAKIIWEEHKNAFDMVENWTIPQATVYPNGTWHTWDSDGCGGENWKEPSVELAKIEAVLSAFKQGFIKPKYQPGDVLYVRETWQDHVNDESLGYVLYKADMPLHWDADDTEHGDEVDIKAEDIKWRPSIHMPKKFARIFLKVTAVRVERVQDISWQDCHKEGISFFRRESCEAPNFIDAFKDLWDSIYPGSWDRNDWVFVYDFERCEKP